MRDLRASHRVEVLGQPTERSSWAASVAMLLQHRLRRPVDPLMILSVARGGPVPSSLPWLKGRAPVRLAEDGWVAWADLPALLAHFGLRRIEASPSPSAWPTWLKAHGPLLLAVESERPWPFSGKHQDVRATDAPHSMVVKAAVAQPPRQQSRGWMTEDALAVASPWPPETGSDWVLVSLPPLEEALAAVGFGLWYLPGDVAPQRRSRANFKFRRG